MTEKKIPTVYVSMPCYDTMQVPTCLSLLKLFDKFTAAKIKTNISTFKSPYVGYSRNILSAIFLESNYDYQLFIDADVSFGIGATVGFGTSAFLRDDASILLGNE